MMSMRNIRLGVIIATALRRTDLLFSRSLKSVLEQSYQPDYILIVDDNFDLDESKSIRKKICQLNNEKLHYIHNTRTRGMSGTGAWNTALDWYTKELSDNDYVAILDDDDCWNKHYLEKCIGAITKSSDSPEQVVAFLQRSDCQKPSVFSRAELTVNSFLIGNPGIQGSNMFFRLGAIKQIGGFDENLTSCTDRDLMIRFIREFSTTSIVVIPEVLVYHFSHNGSISRDIEKKERGLDSFYKKHIKLFSNEVLDQSLSRCEQLFHYENGFNVWKIWNLINCFYDEGKIVVGVAIHNNKKTIRSCLTSIIQQRKTHRKIWTLIVDDNSDDNWRYEVLDYLKDQRIVCWKVDFSNVSRVRNYINNFIVDFFGNVELIGRLDADDAFASQTVVSEIEKIRDKTNADVIFAGNYLKQNGRVLPRTNLATKSLAEPEYLLNRIKQMAEGVESAELPSCNTFMTVNHLEEYPDIPSAEDHFVTTRLLLNNRGLKLAFAEEVLLTVYSLDGQVTSSNKKRDLYQKAREQLYQEAIALCKIRQGN